MAQVPNVGILSKQHNSYTMTRDQSKNELSRGIQECDGNVSPYFSTGNSIQD
jgi:hypothetical protein